VRATTQSAWLIRALEAARSRGLFPVAGLLVLGAALWLNAAGFGHVGHIGYDFRGYLEGAHAVASGQDPYAPLLQQNPDTRPGATGLNAHGYVYPPLLATVLALPIRLGLADGMVWLLWNLVNVAAVLWMGRELNLALRARTDWTGMLAFAIAPLAGSIVMYDLYMGQADLLMAALAIVACGLWLRNNPWAPLVLGAAIAVKPTMALILLVWIYKGDWRAALRGALAAAALVVLPFALIGMHALATYFTFLVQWNGLSSSAAEINQSPYGMLLRLFTVNAFVRPLVVVPWLVTPLRLLAVGGAIVWWLRAVPRARDAERAIALGECLLALPLILLVSPLAEDIHFCLLLPALVGLCWLGYTRSLAPISSPSALFPAAPAASFAILRGHLRSLGSSPAVWVLASTLVVMCVPRMHELIYPNHLLALPGQTNPQIGWLLILVRSGTLLYTAVATLIAGGIVLRAARQALLCPGRARPSLS
jgi:hypothetical protein